MDCFVVCLWAIGLPAPAGAGGLDDGAVVMGCRGSVFVS